VGLIRRVLPCGFNARGTGAHRSRVSRMPSHLVQEEEGHLLQVSRLEAHSHKVPGPVGAIDASRHWQIIHMYFVIYWKS